MRVPNLETNNTLEFIHQKSQLTRRSPMYCSSISLGPITGQTKVKNVNPSWMNEGTKFGD
jgi:hypothetical protein